MVQNTVEEFAGLCWDDVGTDASAPSTNGLDNADILTDGPLNRNLEATGVGDPPYIYYRHIVICTDGDASVTPGGDPEYCGGSLTDSNRPPELACSTLALTSREKLVRILITWYDKNGDCHYKAEDSLVFDWDGAGATC